MQYYGNLKPRHKKDKVNYGSRWKLDDEANFQVIHVASGSHMKETPATFGFLCPNFFEDATWTYFSPPPNILISWGYLVIINLFLQ